MRVPAGIRVVRRRRDGLASEAVEVERKRRHLELAPASRGHCVARPVAVQLDAVALRVGEVEGLADEVVRGAGEPPARAGDATQRPREVGPRGHEQGEVEEAGRPGRARRRVRDRARSSTSGFPPAPSSRRPAASPSTSSPIVCS